MIIGDEGDVTRAVVAKLGQLTTASHNEVVLACGSPGISQLVCLINNTSGGRRRAPTCSAPSGLRRR